MPAIGFGQNVTGGGDQPANTLVVTSPGNTGAGTLAQAITDANAYTTRSQRHPPQEIVIRLPAGTTAITSNTTVLTVTARNLTIRAEGGAVIDGNHLVFDCRSADNVILRDLRFTHAGDDGDPRDCITIDGLRGRHGVGFWIDHCSFGAYPDMCVVTNTKDLRNAPPLLITVSECRFYDFDPSGPTSDCHGALGIHGSDKDRTTNRPIDPDQNTNAYATVCRNMFCQVRRRSPRTSHRTVVHAFNNVLLDWGTDTLTAEQQNGMESGNDGILVAQANYFQANVLKEAIEVAGGRQPARLTVPATGTSAANVYRGGADTAVSVGSAISLDNKYRKVLGRTATPPVPGTMDDTLRDAIIAAAGPTTAAPAGHTEPACPIRADTSMMTTTR